MSKNHQPPAAIGSSSDGVTGGGKSCSFTMRSSPPTSSHQPPAAVGSSSDGVTGGGKIQQLSSWHRGQLFLIGCISWVVVSDRDPRLRQFTRRLDQPPDLFGLRLHQA
jgi:hypothetical protein